MSLKLKTVFLTVQIILMESQANMIDFRKKA